VLTIGPQLTLAPTLFCPALAIPSPAVRQRTGGMYA
jgi:hypothetical protein